ncbi:hypothetical protein [Streptomyces gilvosporeus]|uniref:DUF3558 domain-containing protein n=1 Tax=Streptomyces gilvosporeus TaxID=553510 RepID=A0A1V0TTL2_9ACTN|nr:hypothetical protein [Streptomyces gilvosporeus]ARF56098.1 hypothetical protein B1H19_19590 [Streptomyces gilvosporeus]
MRPKTLRKSFVPGAAVVAAAALAVGLTGCTAGSGSADGSADAKGGDATASSQSAEPGRYQTLPEACRLPARSTVRSLLPGDDQQLSQEDADKIYAGQPDVTYDTDRRVGCHWKRETTEGTRHLALDIVRVVSYDSSVSDDDRAQEIYSGKERAAEIPSDGSATPGSPTPSTKGSPEAKGATPDESTPKNKATSKAKGGKKGASDTASPSTGASASPDGSTAPRVLGGLGDAAFLNDKLATADSGVHRDVTVVFRTSNVIVTITYDQWSTDKTNLPQSQELQDKARSLADELAESLSE